MSRSLPPHPTLEALKKQAKELLGAHRSADAVVCETLRLLRRFAEAPDAEILAAKLALNEAQFALALDYGFESWAAMKRHVEATPAGTRSVAVFGQVTSAATGRSAEGVEVRVQMEIMYLTPLAYACTSTDPEGHYECRLEWHGSDRPDVKIQCQHEAFKLQCMDATERDDGSRAPRRLPPGERLHCDIQLEEGFTLELCVENKQHVPVGGATVNVLVDDGLTVSYCNFRDHLTGKMGLPRAFTTDAPGHLRIEGLSAALPNGCQYVGEVDHSRYATHTLLGIEKLPRDGAVARVTAQLEQGRRLSGRVIAADTGRPIEGAEVACEHHPYGILSNGQPRRLWKRATTDPDGHFELDGLPDEIAGPLTASHAAWQRTKVALRDLSRAEPITMQMPPGRVVTGQVLDQNGRPAASAKVMALTTGKLYENLENSARADGQGSFKLGGLPAGQRVWLVAKDAADDYDCLGVAELRADEDHVVLDRRDMVDVDGRVVDEAGRPFSSRVACVVYAPPDQSGCFLSRSDPSDRLGSFRAALPRNGTVILGLSSHDTIVGPPFFNAVSVTTRDGHLDHPLTITAEQPHRLVLKLIDAVNGEPVARASVELDLADPWAAQCGGRSDEDGNFLLDFLPPGEAEISVVADGYQPIAKHRITIPVEEAYVLQLEPEAQD